MQMLFLYAWQCGLIGAVLGLLAGQVLRGDYNILVDMIVGALGALLGGFRFGQLERAARSGLVGAAVFAAIGGVVFLIGWRTIRKMD